MHRVMCVKLFYYDLPRVLDSTIICTESYERNDSIMICSEMTTLEAKMGSGCVALHTPIRFENVILDRLERAGCV